MTLDDLIQDLQTAKAIAIENKNPNALVSATLAQAKLLGLDKPAPAENKKAVESLAETRAVEILAEMMREIEQG